MNWVREFLRAARTRRASKALILAYHRVTTSELDPWRLSVSPARFEVQMDTLRQRWHPVPLRQLTEYCRRGRFPRRTVAVTFDDGYADNLDTALPVLARYGIPATFFVVSGAIGSGREFWWDELERLLLRQEPLPDRLEIHLRDERHAWELKDAAVLRASDRSLVRQCPPWEAPPNCRYGFYHQVWQSIYPLAEPDRLSALTQIRAWLHERITVRSTHRVLEARELQSLANGRGVEIASHTLTHAALSSLSRDEQLVEIGRSKRDLEDLLHAPVSSFCYPYGDYGTHTAEIVAEAGFERACTTDEGPVWKQSDPLRLPRLHVFDWDRDEFARRLAETCA